MAYVKHNPNPQGIYVGDCVIRAISTVLDKTWEQVYTDLALQGFVMADMPNANHVWGTYLKSKGYSQFALLNTCPDCYTVEDFCKDNQNGTFILATGSHVVAVIDGDYYDAWNSGQEVPIYYWRKG